MSKLTSSRVESNEVVKAADITYGLDAQIENITTLMSGIIDAEDDFVINGAVEEYSGGGMNISIKPIFGICKSTGTPVLETDSTGPYGIGAAWDIDRIDTVEVQGSINDINEQQRAFIDFNTKEKSLQNIKTQQELSFNVNIKHNSNTGSFIDQAPDTTEGWIKIAEIYVPANATDISECTINNIDTDVSGEENSSWTNEKDKTFNSRYINDITKMYREEHNSDGTHKDAVIHANNIDKGTGNNQLNGSVVPVGGSEFNVGAKKYTGTNTIAEAVTAFSNGFNELLTRNTTDKTSLFYQMMLLAHPIGSLYWSGNSTSPADLFGGTWNQIKDTFVWAKGDSDTLNATGGAKTVALSITQIPKHTHTFTGTSSQSTGKTQPSFTGKAVTSDGSSATNTGSESSHTHNMTHYHSRGTMEITGATEFRQMSGSSAIFIGDDSGALKRSWFTDTSHTPLDKGSGSASYRSGLTFTASNGWTGVTSAPLNSSSATITNTGSGSAHSHTMAHTHSVTADGTVESHSHTFTATGTNSNTGGDTNGNTVAHNNMPPYIVKYCWERTA